MARAYASAWREAGSMFKDLAVWLVRDSHSRITIYVVFAFVSTYFLVNAAAHVGESFARVLERSTIIYLVMTSVIGLAAFIMGIRSGLHSTTLGQFALVFATVFVLVSILAATFFSATGYHPPEIPTEASTNWMLFFIVFLIAFPEELIFRDWTPALAAHFGLGNTFSRQLFAAILFGFWHFWAYNRSVGALAFAIIVGFIFGVVREATFEGFNGTKRRSSVGLIVAIALHSVWNAAVFGVFWFNARAPDLAIGLLTLPLRLTGWI